MSEKTTEPNVYRIEAVDGGYEAQMLYQCGAVPRQEWFPINAAGCWSDPDAFSFGLISRRDVFPAQRDAHMAILQAKRINGDEAVIAKAEGSGA